jgi:VanZ family protein
VTPRGAHGLRAALAAGYAAALYVASSRPDPSAYVPEGWLSHDKLLHAAAYAGLGALLGGTLALTRLATGRAIALAAALAAAYGATDEWHQSYVPGRQADVVDLAADALGGLAGAAAAVRGARRRRLAAPGGAG